MSGANETLDFIVIGAQKAGTTSLFEYLRQHPQIALPAGKEVPYFSHDAAYARDWSTYLRNLGLDGGEEASGQTRKWGTVTPHYMVGGVYQASGEAARRGYDERTVPSRIHERLPDVRLVAILRDPVQRAVSHHRMAVMGGHERRSFDHAIDELLRPDSLQGARSDPQELTGYVAWGEYGRILGGFFELFEREQILIVFTDELDRAPAALLSRVQEFIGVRPDFAPENLGQRFRVGALQRGFSWKDPSSWRSPSSPLGALGAQRALARVGPARVVWQALPEGARARVVRRYGRIARRATQRNRDRAPNQVKANAPPGDDTLARLRAHYEQEDAQLAAHLGAPPSWQRREQVSPVWLRSEPV